MTISSSETPSPKEGSKSTDAQLEAKGDDDDDDDDISDIPRGGYPKDPMRGKRSKHNIVICV